MKYLLCSIILLAGCGNYEEKEVVKKPEEPKTPDRFEIVSRQVFRDARYYSRDILLIKDTVTGKEYFAVMGAGLAETHLSMVGKTTTTVEE